MRIALIQSSLIWGNVEENLGLFEKKVAGCSTCDMILLPEMFTSGCMMVKKSPEITRIEKREVADRYAQVRQKMLDWASRANAVIAGSTVYEEAGHYYNRLIVAFPDGSCQYYDKRHCFRMGGENEHFSAGNRQLVFEYRGVRIAAFICYDLRFPVWCRNVQQYDIVFFVANWPESRRKAWNTLLCARAIENQAFVAGVNCVGTDNNGILYAGDSVVVDACGREVGRAQEFQEEILIADCDITALHEFRHKFAVLEDRDNFIIPELD